MNEAKIKKHFIIEGLEFLYLISTLLPIFVHFLFLFIAIEHIIRFGKVINYGFLLANEAQGLRLVTLWRLYDILIISHIFWIVVTVFLVLPGWLTLSRRFALPGLLALAISIINSWFDPFGIGKYITD